MVVRAVIVAPADVQAHLLGRNILNGRIERGDVDLDDLLELAHGLVLEEKRAFHR